MKALELFSVVVLLIGQSLGDHPTFTKPSEAYQFARQPLTDWEVALHAHREPATKTLPGDIVQQRGKTLCPLFSLDSISGEELYWLAKLCELDHHKALLAVQRYLADRDLEHGPEARLLLATLQMRTTGSWEASWSTLQVILKEDPLALAYAQIERAIDDEARKSPQTALNWSNKRYEILLARATADTTSERADSASWMLSAGSDLVHRYYVGGNATQAQGLLDQMNHFVQSQPQDPNTWGSEDLHWANIEMHNAPDIVVLKALGHGTGPALIQPGRVEVLSFFFLGCAPCMSELSDLNAIQQRYGKKVAVTALTTYKVNSYLRPSTHSNIETSVEKTRTQTAPSVAFVITTDETFANYGIHGFPVVAVIDKQGRVRYLDRQINFEDDDPTGELIHKLVGE